MAADSGTSANTVRTHVNAVLTKTGYSRQSDVVALLNGLGPPGSASGARYRRDRSVAPMA
jgi:hypothetical protein